MSYQNTKKFYQKLKHTHNDHQTISIWWCPLYVLLWIILFLVVLFTYNILPTPILEEEQILYPLSFIGERAMKDNIELTNLGVKVVGSDINEVIAIDFFRNKIQTIINQKSSLHDIEFDVQMSSGSFQLDSMTSVYRNIQNFVVKLSPANAGATSSLLLNTHFDSVPISLGGGDSCSMAAVMLEVLRVMSQYPTQFENSVIFLFNGAEENGLQASHMFITQHKWARDVQAYFNMDSGGSGGKEIMFQSMGIPWMMNIYNTLAPHPLSTALAEELFQNRIIPSDTDFRIFRDFGKLPGMDFAFYENGYVYHTYNDVAEIIPMGSYQNAGDNILAITVAAANHPELPGSSVLPSEPAVFFDIFGWFVISYTKTVGIIVNVVVAVIALVLVVASVIRLKFHLDLDWLTIVWEFAVVIVLQFLSLCLAVAIVALLALIFDAASRSMSWFSNQWLVIGLYYFPLFFALGIVPATYLSIRDRNSIKLSYYVQMFLHAQCICYVIAILVMTGMGFRSGFLLLIALVFYALTTFINLISGLMLRDGMWIIVHSIGQIFPFAFFLYNALIMLTLLIPVQGRAGPATNPDLVVGVVVILSGILLGSLIVPVLCIFRRPVLAMCGFLVVFLVFVILMATPIGFPYRYNGTQQRFWIYHTERNFYSYDQTLRKADTGFFMLPMDRHSNDLISAETVPHMVRQLSFSASCQSEIFCGSPLYTSRQIGQSQHSNWVPSETGPIFSMKTTLQLANEEILVNNVKRLTFNVTGPSHRNIFIYPLDDNQLINWNLMEEVPQLTEDFQQRQAYFVFTGHGKINEPLSFFIDIQKTPDTINMASIEITVVGHYNHGNVKTDEFDEFLSTFPDWTHITPWACSYDSYIY
ncbi:endoplasmic reticulum metallopeptidase 1-like isoform X1 [Bradysia coprophila]|uniref:endoplasmic reticulum metallopeptidase 1-like isoform X1 n=1 Tax=Bradysia coprophila TaxID=38358 RepID=UPI00187DB6CB|nr:endoplasmic reticulum metallopeptidase 1-like isoform X1 [Bradysia coprophila]